MKITVETRTPEAVAADLLAVGVAELDPAKTRLPTRLQSLDRALGGALARALASGDFRGRPGEELLLYADGGLGARRLALLGVGPEARLDAAALRQLAARAIAAGRTRRAKSVALLPPSGRRARGAAPTQALCEGAVLGAYRFDRYQTGNDKLPAPARLMLLVDRGSELRALRTAASQASALAESQNLARDLSNEPPNVMNPVALARAAQAVAKEVGLKARVMSPSELEKRGFGAMLGVAKGSDNPPRLIVLEHGAPETAKGRGRKKASRKRRTVCVVGKGVCFDSGGLSLKPSANMVKMKHDMSGGAVVLGVMRAVALLKLPLHVVGIVGAVENMPSAHAYRPDDILTSASGKTIEIQNTDAEGRLVLADALHYAVTEFEPEAVIDLATLTGACGIALGPWAAAVVGNHDGLADRLQHAGVDCDERYWQLPLWDVHREHMRSKIADVKQTGGRDAGTITAAAFLSNFVGDTPWAHLDIASVSDTEKPTALQPGGATGFGVRSVTEALRGLARKAL